MSAAQRVVLLGELRRDSVVPDGIEALVFEQDTELILKLDGDAAYPREGTEALIGQALAAEGHRLGTVAVREGDPLMLLAIVHDLGREPTWEEQWVVAAYRELFRIVEQRGLGCVALPLLGTVHGRMDPARSRALLLDAAGRTAGLRQLWLRT